MTIVCGCGRKVETQADWAGQWISCPGCNGPLYAPFAGSKPSAPTLLPGPADFEEFPRTPVSSPTRLCPYCAETIPSADPTCKFCGSKTSAAPTAPPAAAPTAPSLPERAKKVGDGGIAALVVSLVGYMSCGLLCPVGWYLGSKYEAECRRQGVAPEAAGKAGKIIGIIGSIFLILGALWVVLSLVLG
jgi:hypothetical protein